MTLRQRRLVTGRQRHITGNPGGTQCFMIRHLRWALRIGIGGQHGQCRDGAQGGLGNSRHRSGSVQPAGPDQVGGNRADALDSAVEHDKILGGRCPLNADHVADGQPGERTGGGVPRAGNARDCDRNHFGDEVEQRRRDRPRGDSGQPQGPGDGGIGRIECGSLSCVEQIRGAGGARHQDRIGDLRKLLSGTGDRSGRTTVAHRPPRVVERYTDARGRSQDTNLNTVLRSLECGIGDRLGIIGASRDQPGRRQVQHGMHGVLDPDVQRTGPAFHQDRRVGKLRGWTHQREHETTDSADRGQADPDGHR